MLQNNNTMTRTIYVYADWIGLTEPTLMGKLYADRIRGREIFSFEYDSKWLQSDNAQILDPNLFYYSGRQYLTEGKSNFGLFLDSSPDRWGRVLMQRKEGINARLMKRQPTTLLESDYLLGVHDLTRMGALRFKTEIGGEFLDDNQDMAAPPWTHIRELEEASLNLEKSIKSDDPQLSHWLNMLMVPGSSLGGARPKASVRDERGALWIAKFPSLNDTHNIGLWEYLVNILARDAGLNVAEGNAKQFNSEHHTYLTKRFDRDGIEKRIHYASAMTLLGYSDGADYSEGVSYLELVELIVRYGAKVDEDLAELFRRIIFSICVKNTDDHLRNHGFILTPQGWRLSPAFDINPNPLGFGLKLNISEHDNSLDLELAKSQATYYRLSEDEASTIIQEVQSAISKWRPVAKQLGISNFEQREMEPAFLLSKI